MSNYSEARNLGKILFTNAMPCCIICQIVLKNFFEQTPLKHIEQEGPHKPLKRVCSHATTDVTFSANRQAQLDAMGIWACTT